MPSPFAISAPSTTVVLAENRLGEMPFTVTNTTDQPRRGHASVVPLDGTPPAWFSLAGKAELDLPPRATTQVVVRVEPPLGVPAGTHLFRLDVGDVTAADVEPATGPSCSVVVPRSEARVNRWTIPRGYLATLLGATVGGALGELVILLGFRAPEDQDCTTVGCAIGEGIGQAIFLAFAILFGLVLLWVGAVIGAWVGLRVRHYLGSKTTALFLAILMIPWTIGVGALLGNLVDSLTVAVILAPVLLTAVPGLLARGAVLLIRTRRL
ncbi:MAG: hypothetical protein ACRD29_07510 [Acidimicrobiales bacterium]